MAAPAVGIGASAGGLKALEKFFRSLRANTGFAFVVVQHLSPDFSSMMEELIGRHSRMRISQITNGTRVEPNVIYLAPPGKHSSLATAACCWRTRTPTRTYRFRSTDFLSRWRGTGARARSE